MIHPKLMALMVVGSGQESLLRAPDSPTDQAARRLARALALPHRPISDPHSPDRQLQLLQASGEGWLASLPLDPGQALPDGSTWAEALGAWCQPTLVILGAQQLSSGAAASSTALLRQWRVPLLGLVQWGGTWKGDLRWRDGLPWLGRLEEGAAWEGSDATSDLVGLLRQRWTLLDLPVPS
ncbi:MAG: hypothetical protein VKN83_01560 [Cyanobacteriota bacterium]|nr:hypothetical protein [Cyanobacteriota bacterium]